MTALRDHAKKTEPVASAFRVFSTDSQQVSPPAHPICAEKRSPQQKLLLADPPTKTTEPESSPDMSQVASLEDAAIGQDDRLFAIVLTAQPEIVRTSVLAAIEANTVNCLAAGVQQVNPRQLTKYYPRDSANLLIATQRLRRWYGYTHLHLLNELFQSRLERAKEATLMFASNGFRSSHEDGLDLKSLVKDWQSCCVAARDLLQVLHAQLIASPQTTTTLPEIDLLALLDRVIAGEWPLVQADGTIDMPMWAERRQFNRVPVRIPAILTSATQQQKVIVRDLSTGGIGLETTGDLKPGEPVVIRCALTLRFAGTVVWSRNERAAVNFSKPLFSDDPLLKFCFAPKLTATPNLIASVL